MQFPSNLPTTPWIDGFPLSTPLHMETGEATPARFATLSSLGGLTDPDRIWQFEPTLPPSLQLESLWLSASGYCLRFQQERPFRMIYLRDNLWIGDAPAALVPDLFSTRHEPVSDGRDIRLAIAGAPVVLHIRKQDGFQQFVIIRGGDTDSCEELALQAANALDDPQAVDHAWQALSDLRQAWIAALPLTDKPGHALLALERCAADIRPALTELVFQEEDLSLSTLPLALPALTAMGRDVLSHLLTRVAALPETPAGWIPHQPQTPEEPAWPVWGQSLLQIPETLRNELPVDDLLPRIEAHLAALMGNWTPSTAGLPQWPKSGTALTPEICGGQLEVFDLAVLLLAEMEALTILTANPDAYAEEREALRARLRDRHFSSKRKALMDRKADGSLAGRMTVATLLPFLLNDRPADLSPALLTTPELRDASGIRQWEPREQDPAAAPVRSATQLVLLPVLDRVKDETAAMLLAAWQRGLKEASPFSQTLQAAMAVRLLPYAVRVNPELERYPGWVLWLERHRRAVVGAAASLLFLLPVLTGILYATGPELGRVEEHLTANEANILEQLGRDEDAENLYTELLEKSREPSRFANYYLKRGNLRFQRENYEEALGDYQQVINLDPKGLYHKARWNQAQSLRHLGRTMEATRVLESFIEEYQMDFPDLCGRARLTIQLMNP